MAQEPKWLIESRKYLGQREVPGPGSNAWIKSLWLGLKGGEWFWKQYGNDDSKLPWCGAFVAFVFRQLGMVYAAKYASAKAWLDWGVRLTKPAVGAVCVIGRQGGGHVFFVTGVMPNGRIVGIGGNQNDGVTEASFAPDRMLGYRWPKDAPLPTSYELPVIARIAASTSEA